MPLKIRVKPEAKIFAGGAVLKNVGNRPADLLILSDSPVLREGYMMNIDRSNESDANNIYFLLQVCTFLVGVGQNQVVRRRGKRIDQIRREVLTSLDQRRVTAEVGRIRTQRRQRRQQ